MKNAHPGVFKFDARILSIAAKYSCGRESYGSSIKLKVNSWRGGSPFIEMRL